ncbi:MAG: tRNA (N6-threonylcarbamoyladenosine(37)-N6)-methyltransferase TrmO [Myxococcales bacterium]|nr:tRNA (N6-threonylcarbamoyladenosine(37)-N6)-methyltransferase TrmO [Myxococcales bacterium]
MRFEVEPIGVARTPFAAKADAPRQPRLGAVGGTLELFPGRGFEDALADLEGWDAIWVVYWMDRVQGWRPKVKPPRSRTKRGVFSTRAPHRPNPIGLSAVRLERVEGLVLHVRELDLLDGTPVLDLKPYIPWADAIPDARTGWLEREGEAAIAARPDDPGPRWHVDFAPPAEAQLGFLAEHGEALRAPIEERLALGPAPHAYRRIRRLGDGAFVLAVGAWRARFRVEGAHVVVESIESGERAETAFPLHAAFRARFATTLP